MSEHVFLSEAKVQILLEKKKAYDELHPAHESTLLDIFRAENLKGHDRELLVDSFLKKWATMPFY